VSFPPEILVDLLGRDPIASMYGIFTYIYPQNYPNVGKYTIHGWYGDGIPHPKTKGSFT